MTGSLNLGMAIEFVVAVLLILTIIYCSVLNRRLTRLRADEEILRATISELVTATEIAERAILGLKATASECERSLGGRMLAAEELLSTLDRRLTAGNEIVKRIGAIVGAARTGGAMAPMPEGATGTNAVARPLRREERVTAGMHEVAKVRLQIDFFTFTKPAAQPAPEAGQPAPAAASAAAPEAAPAPAPAAPPAAAPGS